MSGNMLTELDEATLRHAEGLEELILRDNWITIIQPRSLQHLPRLRLLDLSHNNLETLRPAVVEPVERTMEKFFIHGKTFKTSHLVFNSLDVFFSCYKASLTNVRLF